MGNLKIEQELSLEEQIEIFAEIIIDIYFQQVQEEM